VLAAALEPLEATARPCAQVGEQELEVELLEVARRVDAPAGCGLAGSSNARTTWSSASSRAAGEVVGRQLLGADAALGRGRRRRQVDVGDVGVDDLLGLEDPASVSSRRRDLDDADVERDAAVAAGLGVARVSVLKTVVLPDSGKPDDGDLHARRS
jgi:hypothetical protein